MIQREFPNAVRVRPAKGDGGIDVLVPKGGNVIDVYQIKYFSQNLGNSEKRQIKESLKTIRDNEDFTVASWSLVMPLDPTVPQWQWLQEQVVELGVTFPCTWPGERYADGLAAKYPDVIDYYLRDGRQRLEQMIGDLRGLAGLDSPTPTNLRITVSDASDRLRALYAALNRDDPHFRYEFEVTAEPPPLAPKPGLVVSGSAQTDEGCVTTHVLERYVGASKDRPATLSFKVDVSAMPQEVQEAWQNSYTYGAPVELPHGSVTHVEGDMPGGIVAPRASSVAMWMQPTTASQDPTTLRWVLEDLSGSAVAECRMEFDERSRGIGGGFRLAGMDEDRVFRVEILQDPPSSEWPSGRQRIKTRIENVIGMPVSRVLPAFRFLAAYKSPNLLRHAEQYGPLKPGKFQLRSETAAISAEALELLEALNDLQGSVGTSIVVPDGTLSKNEVQAIFDAVRMLRGEEVAGKWSSAINFLDPEDAAWLIGQGEVEAVDLPLEYYVQVGKQLLHLAHVSAVLRLYDVVTEEVSAGEVAPQDGALPVRLTPSTEPGRGSVLRVD